VPTPDRLEEIQRELARLADQVARLQQEVAAARATTSRPAITAAPIPIVAPRARSPAPTRALASAAADPAVALEKFADPKEDPNALKRGCLAAFIAILAALGAIVGAVYYAFYR
jgi:hypothetical protein